MQAGYNYRIKKSPSNRDIPYGVVMIIKEEGTHIDSLLIPSPLAGEGQGEGRLEDLRRELIFRKYSHKTIKGYLCYNRDFLNFVDKAPSEIYAFKGTVPDLRTERSGVVESGLSPKYDC